LYANCVAFPMNLVTNRWRNYSECT